MSVDVIRMDFGVAETTSAKIDALADQMQAHVDQLAAKVDLLLTTWTGPPAVAFAIAFRMWVAEMDHVIAVLRALGGVVLGSRDRLLSMELTIEDQWLGG